MKKISFILAILMMLGMLASCASQNNPEVTTKDGGSTSAPDTTNAPDSTDESSAPATDTDAPQTSDSPSTSTPGSSTSADTTKAPTTTASPVTTTSNGGDNDPVTKEHLDIKVMSQNIRKPGSSDGDSNSIANRSARFKKLLSEYMPDVVGMQESVPDWLYRFKGYADLGYSYVATTEIQPNAQGHTAIIYRSDKFTVVDKGMFWLTPTPNTLSKIEGSNYYRSCVWVLLKDKTTGKSFYFFDTHLDENESKDGLGDRVRVAQAGYLLEGIERITAGSNYPVIITGDFNAKPESEAYSTMTAVYRDTRAVAQTTSTEKDRGTYHGWGKYNKLIDYIFVDGAANVKSFDVLDFKVDGGFVSDHYALFSNISLEY